MHRMPAAVLVSVAVATAFLLPSCCSKPLESANQCVWILTVVEIDRSLLHNAGSLPIYRRADGYSFGREPVALGTMQGSTEGLWSINVTFKEPVVAFSGRSGVHEYEVLRLSGKCGKDGTTVVAQGAFPAEVVTGVATEVHVERISDTKLRVQPATRGKLLPYIFTFDSTPPQPRAVSIPLI